MTEDFIDNAFADLDTYYPGSKRKRREEKKEEVRVAAAWDSKPYIKSLPDGTDMEFFTIGALAMALGRPIVSIRHWIKSGFLPVSPYRLPAKIDVNGEERLGRRLYSRPMIEVAVLIFSKAGLLHAKRVQLPNQELTSAIAEAWEKIRATEMNIKTN